jgi:hypothetical protein
MQNGQVHSLYSVSGTPVRRASQPSPAISASASSPTAHQAHQRSYSQSSSSSSHPYLYTLPPTHTPTMPPQPSTTHMQAPQHVSASPLPQSYHEIFLRQQQQLQQQQLIHGLDPHGMAHAQMAPAPTPAAPPLSSKPRPPPIQTNPQQLQSMTNTVGATPLPLSMKMAAATRLREQVQTVPQSRTAVAGASVSASASASADATAGANAGSPATAVPTTPVSAPGTQTHGRGPPSARPLHAYAPSPVSARTQPPSSASTTPPSSSSSQQQLQQQQQQQLQQLQQQHQYQRIAVPPAIAAFKVLQPAKDLLEQTWEAAIAAVQNEFAVVQADLSRSAHETQALKDLLQRIQPERMQALQRLHSSQTQLRQCTCVSCLCYIRDVAEGFFACAGMVDYQAERRVRVHLERRLAEMTQVRPRRSPCGTRADCSAW